MRRRRILASIRERVAKATHYRCGYGLTSQRVIGPRREIDHLIPGARGGTNTEDNLWLACPICNSRKADRVEAVDPMTGGIVALFDPRRSRWTDHFEWLEDGAIVRGTTSIGRAIVDALAMVDEPMVVTQRLCFGSW